LNDGLGKFRTAFAGGTTRISLRHLLVLPISIPFSEARMSKPNATAAPIPVGILVLPTAKRAPVEDAEPKRAPTLAPPARSSPWLWFVTAGSVIYAVLILVIGLSIHRSESTAVSEVSTPVAVIEVAAAPTPIAPQPKPEPEPEPTPSPPRVLLLKPSFTLLIDETPQPLPLEIDIVSDPVKPIVPPAKPKPVWNQADPTVYASCEQIGTNILFVKNPVEAFKMAKEEKKLVFMVHLSGNLEDKEFT
jgi:hypothetical protein